MRKHALFVVVGLAVLAYWLWQKFRPIPAVDTSTPLVDNGADPTGGDAADADFGAFLATGVVPQAASPAPAAAAAAVASTDPTASGDDGFTGGGGGASGGAGISRSD